MGGQEHEDLERILFEKNANAIPLSYTFLKYITNDFSDERVIGSGGFGVVYKLHTSQVIDSPQMERCIEIAQLCMDADEHKRPTIDEIIGMLNEAQRSRSNTLPSLEVN
nr:unnamed protein product [Digitaria exilis]